MRHFEIELAELRGELVAMGGLVEQAIRQAVAALTHPVAAAREQAKALDDQLDAKHSELENRLHTLLALQMPKATDLRLVVSSLRIISVFEQMGDLAEGVSKRAAWIARHQLIGNPQALRELCDLVVAMIRDGIEAYTTGAIDTARRILQEEDRSDILTKQCFREIQQSMADRPDVIREFTHLLRAVANLEYIGDLAVQIAEEAVFIHAGRMVRHHHEDL